MVNFHFFSFEQHLIEGTSGTLSDLRQQWTTNWKINIASPDEVRQTWKLWLFNEPLLVLSKHSIKLKQSQSAAFNIKEKSKILIYLKPISVVMRFC